MTAGPNVTVDGNGSTANPYVISATGGASTPTAVQAQDTPTVDTTVTGTGTAADPYMVSAAVVLDATPPGGGSNLLHAGPGGLYAECADVRGCLSSGNGIDYDPATGEIAARPSIDVGNTVTFGSDGGLYAAGGGTSTATVVQAQDTPTVDTTVTGTGTAADPYMVSGAVVLDPAPPGGGSNLLHVGPAGLYAECADVRGCLTAGTGIDYDPTTGTITAEPPAPLVTDCGLTGAGTAADPLAAAVGTWSYPCSVDTYAGQVYCDSSGILRSEPRGQATVQQDFVTQNYTATAVPAANQVVAASRTLTAVNPDPCRPAFVIYEVEIDVDLTLPAGGRAVVSMNGDDMQLMQNGGTSTVSKVHQQSTKVFATTIPAGGTDLQTTDIQLGQGLNGATYTRIQSIIRAFIFVL